MILVNGVSYAFLSHFEGINMADCVCMASSHPKIRVVENPR